MAHNHEHSSSCKERSDASGVTCIYPHRDTLIIKNKNFKKNHFLFQGRAAIQRKLVLKKINEWKIKIHTHITAATAVDLVKTTNINEKLRQ